MKNFIGIGTDIVEIDRIKKAVKKTPKFLDRVFSESELKYCNTKKDKYPHLAVRFAAKEAIIKSLNKKELALKDIEITNTAKGKPLAKIKNVKNILIHLSLSHSQNYAVASAVAIKKD